MTEKETVLFIAKMRTFYPNAYRNMNDIELRMLNESWQEMLAEIPLKIAIICLKRHATTSKWAPTIADILEQFQNCKNGYVVDDGEAWRLAKLLISRKWRGYGVESKNDISDIPETVQKAVNRIGIEEIATSENQEVMRSNFLKVYRIIAEREETERRIPEHLKIEQIKKLLPQQQQPPKQPQKVIYENNNINFNKNMENLQYVKQKLLSRSI